MPDRTGGMRAGVFREALRKANLMHPEFLLSVGDLIDGYTLDPQLLDSQWKEFDQMVDTLDMPFYYVPGNHDISNEWMEEQWRERLGQPYYHFQYKGALFLVLHTEDGGRSGISAEQGVYFAKALAEHPDVRWTFLFMHRPLWSYGNKEGFEVVEKALRGRTYTLFSGHHHNYYYEADGSGNERLILGTAGGGSYLRGAEFGEFDHITHVVLTESGPKITHLSLDGFVEKDVVNEENRARVETLRSGDFVQVAASVSSRPYVASLEGRVTIENPDQSVLDVEIRFPEIEGVRFQCDRAAVSLGKGETVDVPFSISASNGGAVYLDRLPPVFVEIVGTYGRGTVSELGLPTRKQWRIDWQRRMLRDDSARRDYEALDPPGYLTQGWDWHGPEDCLLHFSLSSLVDRLVLRAEVEDDVHLFLPGELSDRLRLYFDAGSGAKVFDFVPTEQGELLAPKGYTGAASLLNWQGKLIFQIEIPFDEIGLAADSSQVRFNLRYLDHDWSENQKPSRLYWKPEWGSEEDFEGSGTFIIP
ncbi:metallophosphoesterase [Pelagicoccus sp. SDUM812005]|uniref:metallophosphoesterase n=1 Tax=Pelagicoccus sp. SDUM812005 TaxID=3041257 RepID=UPI00280FBDF4|nr:metallophosphoesterase [Pelagicoccus sp. SDUM812005]MDQ8183175.1 metallophosphoesterase [Pelagicoccus sp. SDUM812005]